MKEFLYLKGGLRSLQWSTRFVYTLFLLFSLASYAVMFALAAQRSGFSSGSVAAYYAGDESQAHYPKTTGELLEVTHFHLFSMPMLLFVQGHLFMMTRWPRRLKIAIVSAAFVGAALDLAAPWLVLYVSRDLACAKMIARVLLGPALIAFALVPLREMWWRDEDERSTVVRRASKLGEE
jgi:ABC-type enterobactin transport system permease subunit